jgi:hypothetical protein
MKFERILERKKRQFEKKNTNNINIRSRLFGKDLLLVNDLSYHEIVHFMEEDYNIIYQQDLYGERNYYLIRPPLNESFQHCFLVQIIKEVLRNNFEDVREYRTRKPDIVFRIRNKFIALEIETGKVLSKNRKRFLEKVRSLNKDYGDDWFIVVTNRNLLGKYKRFGKTVTRKNFLRKVGSYVDFNIE